MYRSCKHRGVVKDVKLSRRARERQHSEKDPSLKILQPSSHLFLTFLALLATACQPPEEPVPRHVLFITIDTLRADHLSLYGYGRPTSPGLEAFAEGAVTFERAMAQWPKTGTSFASLFTGQYPQTTGLTHKAALRIPDEYLTLPELLAQEGFTNVAVVSNGVLGEQLGWDRGFTEYLQTWKGRPETDDPAEYRKSINARRVNELALPLLDKHKDADRVFAWIHYSDPHAPYILPDDVENPFIDDAFYTGEETVKLHDPRATALDDRRDLKYYVAQYDANVQFTDRYVEELLQHVDGLGLLDDALVIFTADHGESLGDHGYYFGHGRKPYNNGVHVPLVISYPPALAKGRRIPVAVELVDLYPTLQEWLLPDKPVPGLEGESLMKYLRPSSDEAATSELRFAFSQAGGGSPTTHYRMVQDERYKLIYHPPMKLRRRDLPAKWEFYDLGADPGETNNLSKERPPELRRLHQALNGWMKGSDWIRRPRAEIEAQNQETLRALRALGYTE